MRLRGSHKAGVRRIAHLVHTGNLIAAVRYAAPAWCGASIGERLIVACDEGGRVYRRACASLVTSFTAGVREPALERITALHTDVLIAAFRCDAPALCGVFADRRRVVAGGEVGRVRARNARPAPFGRCGSY